MTALPKLKRDLVAATRRLEDPPPLRRRLLRSGRRSLLALPVGLVVAGGLTFAATRVIEHGGSPQYRSGRCPTDVVALGPHPFAAARRTAVRQAGLAYPGRDLRGIRSTGAQIVTRGSARSADAQRCGLLGRTVLVSLALPAPFHSASLSQGAVYVSRVAPPGEAARFQLWGLEH